MTLKKSELKQYLAFAEITALEAGKILSSGFHRKKRVSYKGEINPVTQFDLRSEKYVVSRVTRKYREHSVLTEEGSDRTRTSMFRWVIDPLDGTVNYAHGFPVYSVSIALQYAGQSVVGVVYDPERQEMYSAARGIGAFLNKKRITVTTQRDLKKSLLATGFAYNIGKARRNNLGMFSRMMKHAQAVRRLGSAALDLCWLAAGRFDGFWEYYLHPWDTAAAIVIVKEAGGKVTRIDGKDFSIFDKQVLASNGLIHSAMMAVLTGKKRRL
ncbi:MAG: inositol monophosphatase [Candidatus Zixiibacteriota bacterium]|nr:MAG: inositol monophosphatase [candidate division Zixibacteria bacterium]